MCIFLLSGTMGAFEIVHRDFIRHAYSKKFLSSSFPCLFFFFPLYRECVETQNESRAVTLQLM